MTEIYPSGSSKLVGLICPETALTVKLHYRQNIHTHIQTEGTDYRNNLRAWYDECTLSCLLSAALILLSKTIEHLLIFLLFLCIIVGFCHVAEAYTHLTSHQLDSCSMCWSSDWMPNSQPILNRHGNNNSI